MTLHLEFIGAGGEHDITITPAWAPVAGAFEWTQNIPVAGNVVQIDAYKPVVTARLRPTPGGNVNPVGLPIYGFEELPMISIY